jgi:hypothetical protein
VRGRSGEVDFTFVVPLSDTSGLYAGKPIVAGMLQRDDGKDARSAAFTITVVSANNQVLAEDTGTFKLTRIPAELLH